MRHRNGVTESKIEKDSLISMLNLETELCGMRGLAPFIDCLRMMIEL